MKTSPSLLLLVPMAVLGICGGCASLDATNAVHGGNSYGAAAYAPSTQDWRLRWQAADPRRARQTALADCGPTDCQIVLEFGPGQCGTLALGQNGYGVGKGDSPEAAETAALGECRRADENCRVVPAECNS